MTNLVGWQGATWGVRHLWEIKHPYYCSDSNYFANGHCFEWDDWASFYEEFRDTDKDLNLLFRWDWKRVDPDDYPHSLVEDREFEEPVPGDRLHLYFMAQRKGYFYIHIVNVTEADESAVREFLQGYADYMVKIWEPFLEC